MKKYFVALFTLLSPLLLRAQAPDTVADKASKLKYQNWEIYPSFLAGSLTDYVRSNFSPQPGLKKGFRDTAVFDLQLDTLGAVKHISTLRNSVGEIDKELIRILNNTAWKPAIYNFTRVNFDAVLEADIQVDSIKGDINIKLGQYYRKMSPLSLQPLPANEINNGFTIVEKQPSFPGGFEAFGQYLMHNIKYPQNARLKRIQGKVFITFMVETDGSLAEFHIISSPDDELSFEALRVLKQCPKFQPGILGGKPVRVAFTVPIGFNL